MFLLLLSMFCWGSWANTFKLTGRWRFELFYFDYAFGVFLASTVAALTFGNMGTDGVSFSENLILFARYQNLGFAFLAGCIFNLANMLLVAAIAIAGLAVAFPVGIGLALIIGVILNYALNQQGNPLFLFGGVALLVLAIVVDAQAYRAHARSQVAVAPPAPAKVPHPRSPRPVGVMRGVLLALGSGVLMGVFYPLVELSKSGDLGLGPYTVGFIFSLGVLSSTFFYNIYFLRLPVTGAASLKFKDYFRGTKKQHFLGVLGGIIWAAGAVANFVAASTPPEVQVGPAVSYGIGQGATLISALWGLLVWR